MSTRATKPTSVDWVHLLRAFTHRNEVAVVEADATGTRVTMPTLRPRWLVPPLTWAIRPRPTHTLALDAIGAQVLAWCDGRTVEALVDAFAARYGLTFHEARVAVSGYLRLLVERHVVALEIEREAA